MKTAVTNKTASETNKAHSKKEIMACLIVTAKEWKYFYNGIIEMAKDVALYNEFMAISAWIMKTKSPRPAIIEIILEMRDRSHESDWKPHLERIRSLKKFSTEKMDKVLSQLVLTPRSILDEIFKSTFNKVGLSVK
jgi:hypothetical protein